MKTMVELPDDLLNEVQALARAEDTTMQALLEEGLRAVIARHRQTRPFTLRDASVPGDGLTAEFSSAGWTQIREAGYGDRW
jgi:hypothetical protein